MKISAPVSLFPPLALHSHLLPSSKEELNGKRVGSTNKGEGRGEAPCIRSKQQIPFSGANAPPPQLPAAETSLKIPSFLRFLGAGKGAMAGQSDPSFSSFSPPEIEFLAEDETVEIVPNVRMEALHMISGDFGPFLPQIAAKVPLWLAVAMRKRGKCTVRPPEWMSVDKLTQVLESERESPREFQPLPFHYIEISKLLFDHAQDDIPDIYMVRSLIEDIRDVRFHKVETGLETISSRTHAIKLKNLSAMEVNIIRPFIVRTLQTFYKHDSPEMNQQPETAASRQPQVTDRGPRRDLRRR